MNYEATFRSLQRTGEYIKEKMSRETPETGNMLFCVGNAETGMANSIVVRNGMLYHFGDRVTTLTDVVSVAASGMRVLALTRQGDIYYMVLETGARPRPPYPIVTYRPARLMQRDFTHVPVYEIAVGTAHVLALLDTGLVLCAGSNQDGCLGMPPTVPVTHYATFMHFGGSLGDTPATSVAAGCHVSGLIDAFRHVHLCGSNWVGQLGFGHRTNCHTWTQSTLSSVATLSLSTHGAAATVGGDVWTWGANWDGQLGHGDYTNRDTPALVGGLTDKACSAVCGESHTLLHLRNGKILTVGRVWTTTEHSTKGSTVFVVVPGLPSMAQVAANNGRSAGLSHEGELYEWGPNTGGFSATPVLQLPHVVPVPPTLQCVSVSLAARPRRAHHADNSFVFAMVAHKRLGADSAYNGLSDDLVRRVLETCGVGESLTTRRLRGVWSDGND